MSLAVDARGAVRGRPYLLTVLRTGVVNYATAVAELGLSDDEMVAAAFRRLAVNLPPLEADPRDTAVTMRSGVDLVGEDAEVTGGGSVFSVTDVDLTGGGPLTAIIAEGKVDPAVFAAVLSRLDTESIVVDTAGVMGDTLAVAVPHRQGVAAPRVIKAVISDLYVWSPDINRDSRRPTFITSEPMSSSMVSPSPRDDDGNISLSFTKLLDELDLGVDELDWQQSFVGFDDKDIACLADLRGVVEARDEALAGGFIKPVLMNERVTDIIGRSKTGPDGFRAVVSGYYRLPINGNYDQNHYAVRTRTDLFRNKFDMPLHYFGGMLVDAAGISTDELRGRAVTDATESPSGEDVDRVEGAVGEAFTDMMAAVRGLSLGRQVVNATYLHSYSLDVRGEVRRARGSRGDLESVTSQLYEETVGASGSIVETKGLAARQVDMTEEVAAELSNLSATVEKVTATANGMSSWNDGATIRAKEGRAEAGEAIDVMRQAGGGRNETTVNVETLAAAIDEIQGIVEVTDEVADQTNLLVFSAFTETARTDKADSGLAVVVDEVKLLVNEPKPQAGRIGQVIGDVTDHIEDIIEALSSADENIDHGIEWVGSTVGSLDGIVGSVAGVTDDINEVAWATDEQVTLTSDIATFADDAVTQAGKVAAEIDCIFESVSEQTEQAADLDTAAEELDHEAGLESFRRRAETTTDGGVATKGGHHALTSVANIGRAVGGGTGPTNPTGDRIDGAASTSTGDGAIADPTGWISTFIRRLLSEETLAKIHRGKADRLEWTK